jgi:hypothetical protein
VPVVHFSHLDAIADLQGTGDRRRTVEQLEIDISGELCAELMFALAMPSTCIIPQSEQTSKQRQFVEGRVALSSAGVSYGCPCRIVFDHPAKCMLLAHTLPGLVVAVSAAVVVCSSCRQVVTGSQVFDVLGLCHSESHGWIFLNASDTATLHFPPLAVNTTSK